MAAQSNKNKPKGKDIPKQPAPKNTSQKSDLLSTCDNFFQKHKKKIFWASLALTCLFGALLFDLKISEGTDDSGYIMAANDFIKGKAFPTWHGSFYPIFLSLPILLFGVNLFALKFVSFLLMIGHLVFLYMTFRNRVSATILSVVILLSGINSYILYHASSTYSEPLYFFLQSLSIFFFLTLIDKLNNGAKPFLLWKLWLGFGVSVFLLSITRNVGIGILITILVYLLINKQFKEILFSIGSFLVFQIPYSLYKTFYWHVKDAGFKGQLAEMYFKDPYNHAYGNENFSGFVTRFIGNTELYLSKHFFKILGLQDAASISKSLFLAIIVVTFMVVAFVIAIRKKNKYMQFIGLYLAVAIGATFVSQQVFWDQVRLILIYVPLMLIFIAYGIYEVAKNKSFVILQPALLLLFIIMFFTTLSQTIERTKINTAILDKNLEGNKYYGFTPDWVHYFQASEWAAKNLPKDVGIACRKPSMSFIYSKGREFHGIYKLPMISADSAMLTLVKEKADVLIVDNNEMGTKNFPAALFDSCRLYNRYTVIGKNHFYTVYQPGPNKKEVLLSHFKKYGITAKTDAKAFLDELKKSNDEYYVEDADSLLKMLKTNNIRYLILASLRAQPAEKNGNIIDTMQRLVYYIQLKYPNLFVPVHQIGDQDDEPAQLVEVNY